LGALAGEHEHDTRVAHRLFLQLLLLLALGWRQRIRMAA
jgi:hypothetical protein